MATPEVIAEQEALAHINADYTERYGFHDAENYLYKAPKGLTRELVERISEFKNEPQWMRDFRLKALDHFLAPPMPTWGSPMLAEVDFDDIHYFVRASERAERSWDDVPEDVKKTFDRLGIPEAERQFLAGVGAQYESEVVYHQVRDELEKQGVIFIDMDSGLREHEDLVREHFATIIPANDNKLAALNSRRVVGRLVRLRAAGRPRRDAAAGLLPHQHGEHGPVRADADHRRRGLLRALRRGLHRADVLVGLAALRGRRADRQAGRADPLHDRAELVAERVQPRHQARGRRDRRDGRVGRLQPRLEADDEVPVGLPDGRARPRRDPLDRVRRHRPAPGRGRQDRPRRAEHDEQHLRQVDLQGRRALLLPRPARGGQGRATAPAPRSSATRCCSTRSRARTPTRRSASARTTSTSATRRRSPRSARSSCSTCSRTGSTRRRPPS